MFDKQQPTKISRCLTLCLTIVTLFLLSACVEHWSEDGVEKWRVPGEENPQGNQVMLSTVVAENLEAKEVPGGDPDRGLQALQAYGCGSCHIIPGVRGADSLVGPPLTYWAERRYIAGQLANTPHNLIQWIRYPQQVEPGTAMPNLEVSEQDAFDMAAYLYTLDQN